MTNTQDLLAYLATDAGKWAAEFCKSARDKGLRYDEDLMRGWFAQAIMAGRIEEAKTMAREEPARDEWDKRALEIIERAKRLGYVPEETKTKPETCR